MVKIIPHTLFICPESVLTNKPSKCPGGEFRATGLDGVGTLACFDGNNYVVLLREKSAAYAPSGITVK